MSERKFGQDEDKMIYFFLLSSLRREHFAEVGIECEETYHYLTDKEKMNIIENLTAKQKAVIRRDYLIANFKNASGSNATASLLLDFAEKHIARSTGGNQEWTQRVYEKRHQRIEEKKAVLLVQEQARQEAEPPMNHSPKRKRLPAKRQRKRLQLDTIITLGRRSGGIRPLSFHGIALYNKEQGFTANRLAGLPGGASADMCRHPRKLPFLSLSNCLPIPRRHPLPVLSSVSLFSIYLLSVSVHTCLHRLVFPVAKVDCRAGFRHFEVHFLQNSSFLRKRNFPEKASEAAGSPVLEKHL